jgi:hypothetical protein
VWARIVEWILAIWLIISRFILSYGDLSLSFSDFAIPFLIILFAALSYIGKLNKMHLLHVIPAAWLLAISFAYPTPWLPFGLQNHILVALLLLTFAIIPSRASEPPRPWQHFFRDKQ